MTGPWPYEDDEHGDDRIWADSNGGHPDDSIWGYKPEDDDPDIKPLF